jgi:hypothetical protein
MEIILAIVYFILAGLCWKSYRETAEDNCQFGMLIFVLVGLLCLFFKFLW